MSLSRNANCSYTGASQTLGFAVNLRNKFLDSLYSLQLDLKQIQIIDLSDNNFSRFPSELCLMQNLRRVKLDNNQLKAIPVSFFSNLRLEFVSLSNNLFQGIPAEIMLQRDSLKFLDLSKNHIREFQIDLCELSLLNSLNVSSNDFLEIPVEMTKLINLNEFSIDWFKYCSPKHHQVIYGGEGQTKIRILFALLIKNIEIGFINFHQFVSYFSQDKVQIRRDNKIISRVSRSNSDNVQNENFANGNILDTSEILNESVLFRDSEGIQLIPKTEKKAKIFFNKRDSKKVKNEEESSEVYTNDQQVSLIILDDSNLTHNSNDKIFNESCAIPKLKTQTDQPNICQLNESFDSQVQSIEKEGDLSHKIGNGILANDQFQRIIQSENDIRKQIQLFNLGEIAPISSPNQIVTTRTSRASIQQVKLLADVFDNLFTFIDPRNGQNLLHLAVLDEDISAIRNLVQLRPSLMIQEDSEKHTPLSLAILEEKFFATKILIFSNSDVNAGGSSYGSCLNIGVVKLQQFLVRDLLRFGADVNQRDQDGNSALHYLFLSFGRDPSEARVIAEMLLSNGANPNAKNNDKYSPLHLAVRKGLDEAVRFVLNYNKSTNKDKFNLNKQGGIEKASLLHVACEMNHQIIVKYLLECQSVDVLSLKLNNKRCLQLTQRFLIPKKFVETQQCEILKNYIGDQFILWERKNKLALTNQTRHFKRIHRNQKFSQGRQFQNLLGGMSINQKQADDFNIDSENIQVQNQEDSYSVSDDLDDSADLFPVETEDGLSKVKNNQKIFVSLCPRMIQRGEREVEKDKPSFKDCLFIEDEDFQGDVPKWAYNKLIVRLYSPNDLQKIQGVNEVMSTILEKKHYEEIWSFFRNLKHYKQVMSSARSLADFEKQIVDESLPLAARLEYVNQLKLLSFKILQIMRLITKHKVYQHFCRSGVIEDFLRLGDDNLSDLVGKARELNKCVMEIYNKLNQAKNLANNQIINLFVDLFADQRCSFKNNSSKKVEKIDFENIQFLNNEREIKTDLFMVSNSEGNQNKIKEDNFSKRTEKIKINYNQNILCDYLQFQQNAKVNIDLFTNKEQLSEQDFDKIILTEEEFPSDLEGRLPSVIQNYQFSKIKSNQKPFVI